MKWTLSIFIVELFLTLEINPTSIWHIVALNTLLDTVSTILLWFFISVYKWYCSEIFLSPFVLVWFEYQGISNLIKWIRSVLILFSATILHEIGMICSWMLWRNYPQSYFLKHRLLNFWLISSNGYKVI